MKIENIPALFFLLSPPVQSPDSYFPSTGNGGKPNLTVFHACGVYKAARILNLNSIKIGFHLISGIINSWASAPQRTGKSMCSSGKSGDGVHWGCSREGKLRQALNSMKNTEYLILFQQQAKGIFTPFH